MVTIIQSYKKMEENEVKTVKTSATSEHFNKTDLANIMDSCRVCLAQSLNMRCIFDSDKENILDEIHFCTGVRLKPEAGLPTQMCEICLQNLSVAYKFKTSCLIADKTLNKLMLSRTIKIEVEPNDEDDNVTEYKEDLVEEIEDIKEEVLETVLEEKRLSRRPVKVKAESLPRSKGRPKKIAARPKAPRRLKQFKFKRLCCEQCDLKFDTKEQNDEHKRTVHKESENWVCEICGKVFIHRASHYTHVRSHKPPQYNCDQCDYKTWHKHDLVKHVRIHTGLKLYQCEYCTASYHTSSNLTSHIRRLHMNERPHDCTICRRTFFDRTKLNRHLDSHLEIKRFECDVCHACFTRRCYWKKHLLRQHDIVTPPQRPGRQKMNLVIGECLINSRHEAIAEYYAKEGADNKV